MTPLISVPERGHSEIPSGVWRQLSQSAAFWQLVTSNVIRITALPGGRAQLDGLNLVGRALCDGFVVECREKIDGALSALLTAGTTAFRTRNVPAPSTELGPMIALLVRLFVDEVRRYVGDGREWRYESRRFISSRAAGRLIVPATMRLRARGMRHMVAFDRQEITRATDMNRLVYAALREVEVLARLVPITDESLSEARAMSLFFEDCRDAEVLFGASHMMAGTIERLRMERGQDRRDQMLALAGVLLSHTSFEASQIVPGVIPSSWFINLESLFEEAVRCRLRAVVADGTSVSKGNFTRPAIFPDVNFHHAEPDLVLEKESEAIVGDVKYKDWIGSAGVSDLYQLLVHAGAFGADRSFLIFPSDEYDEVYLGRAVTGAVTWLFALDVRDLDSGLKNACDTMSVATR
jgi:5-methylcytosine-specific restriction endonuclease McrBC regulatory subunit McrC